jgi:hypothetical protein
MKKLLVALSIFVISTVNVNAFADTIASTQSEASVRIEKISPEEIKKLKSGIGIGTSVFSDIKDEKDLILVVDEKELKVKKKLNKRGE